MGRGHQLLDAIVLRTHDVGEADRLCIVFTRERVRMALRARAVRKLGSRTGALLLPGRRVILDVRDEGSFVSIAAAKLNGDVVDLSHPAAFVAAQQGIELLLSLTEDDEPLPMAFDALYQFLHACGAGDSRALLPFRLRLLHILGMLPSHVDDRRFALLTPSDREAVLLTRITPDFAALCAGIEESDGLRAFVESLLETYVPRRLKSDAVCAAFAN